jgi:hypothetical protein
LTWTSTQDFDLDGDVDLDSILDLARRPPVTVAGMLVEKSPNLVEVDVNDRVNLYVAVKLEVWVDVEVLVEVHDPSRPPRTLVRHLLSGKRRIVISRV